jgi:2-dehydro-3-deoxyphosphogluconate aldolase/(4S)-4-hydroxy-2-oxoglutarate aldolase
VAPRDRLLDLVAELADAGVRAFEITFDDPEAADDLIACRERLRDGDGPTRVIGAGTLTTAARLEAALACGADFGVSPVLDLELVSAAGRSGLSFVPGVYTPTEALSAWRGGATFVKLFPASSLGPAHVRELRGPMPDIETIPTGGIDASNARAFLDAGAVAVGVGSAIVRATPAERRAIVEAVGR